MLFKTYIPLIVVAALYVTGCSDKGGSSNETPKTGMVSPNTQPTEPAPVPVGKLEKLEGSPVSGVALNPQMGWLQLATKSAEAISKSSTLQQKSGSDNSNGNSGNGNSGNDNGGPGKDKDFFEVSAINVQVKEVSARKYNTEEWIVVSSESRSINLLNLNYDAKDFFANNPLSPGSYDQIRIKIDKNATATVDSEVVSLEVPSGATSGIKMKGLFSVEKGYLTKINFIVDGKKSVIRQNKNKYSLRPTIQIEGVAEDLFPPLLAIVTPVSHATKVVSHNIEIEYSDDFLNLSSLSILIDGVESKSGFQITDSGAVAQKAFSEGKHTIQAKISDKPGYTSVTEPVSLVVDLSAPIITFGHDSGVELPTSSFSLNVKIDDLTSVESKVFLNGIQVSSTGLKEFQVPLTLVPGTNNIKVESVDQVGNSKTESTVVVFDKTPPVLTQVLPDSQSKYYTNTLPISVPYKVTSNEPLSLAKVNINESSLASDFLSFSGNLAVNSAGVLAFNASAKDIAGNESQLISSFEVVYDNAPPVIVLSKNGPDITNQSSVPVNVVINDSSPVWSKVIVNGLVIFETRSKSFSAPFELNVEGKNTFKISSIDDAKNTSNSNVIEVIRDTIAPTLSELVPANGTILKRVMFEVSGVASEPLKELKIDNTVGTINGNRFSLQYVADSNGPKNLNISYSDLVGNIGHTILSIDVQDILLLPALVTVVPDPDNIHMWVVGAPSAARPASEVSVSAALFGNSGSAIASANGEFEIKLKKFNSADVKVEDLRTGEIARTSVAFSGATTFAGVVKDVNGTALPNVSIGFVGSAITALTDENGKFLFNNPPTGDQSLIVDGSTIPQSTTGPTRLFSKTKVALNIGLGQNNVLEGPVYLTPLLKDGTETNVIGTSGAVVQSNHAPGVQLTVPSGSVVFPNGSTNGAINMMTIDADKATTTVPSTFVPSKVIALEPSGTQFSKPVAIAIPNDNELPPKTPMVFFSMNSAKGIWEIDGYGRVSEDGNSVITNSDSGITHFSLTFAVPLAPVISTLKNPNLLGIAASQGGLDTHIKIPNFKILEKEVAPVIRYKSGWANPTAVVSNSFNIPNVSTTTQGSGTGDIPQEAYYVLKRDCATETKNYIVYIERITRCNTYWDEYWSKLSYTFNWQNTNLWIPDSISSQFFVGSVASDQVNFASNSDEAINKIGNTHITNAAATDLIKQTGIPQSSIISYAVELKDPTTGEYLSSGVHPSLARYQVKLKNLTITTNTTTTSEDYGRGGVKIGNRRIVNDPLTSVHTEMREYLPEDLQANILVQNRVDSKIGRGWAIGGVQKIYNPTNSLVMVEEASGEASTYALNSVISTVFDGKNTGIDLLHGVDLTTWPFALAGRVDSNKNSFVTEIDLSSASSSVQNVKQIPSNSGKLASQGYYQCNSTINCDLGGCYNVYSGTFSSVMYDYKSLAQLGGLVRNSSGDIFTTDLLQHALYKDGGLSKLIGTSISVDSAVERPLINYSLYYEYFNAQGVAVNEKCNALFGTNCGPAQVQPTVHNCNKANVVRTCSASDGLLQVVKCNTTQEPQYKFASSVGSIGNSGSGLNAMNSPTFVIGSPNGKLIVSDTGNNRVLSVDPISGTVTKIAGSGGNTDTGDGGLAINAGIYHPRGLVFDNSGNLYISTESGYIRKVDVNGVITKVAGLPLSQGGVVTDQGAAATINFNSPQGMVFNSSYDVLFVADTNNHRVISIDLATGIANKIAGSGQCVVDEQDGNAALFASLCKPTVLGIDDRDNLLIVDSGHNKIRRITFSSSSSGPLAYMPSTQDQSKLFKNQDGTWTRQYRNGAYDSFDTDGLQVRSTDKLNRITSYNYDSDRNLVEIVYPNGQTITYNYAGGYLKSIIDPANRITTFNYSGGQLVSANFPDGTSRQFEYDTKGQMVSQIDQNGNKSTYEFNEWNRLKKITYPDNTSRIINDIASQTIANLDTDEQVGVADGVGFGEGQVNTKITDGNNVTIEMSQDHMGFISTIKDANNKITTIKRDNMGRPILITKPDLTSVSYTYDPSSGDLVSIKDIASGVTKSATYDVLGNLKSITDGNGKTTTFSYDLATGLLISKVFPSGVKVTFDYNSLGLTTKKTIQNGSFVDTATYTYDNLGRLKSISDSTGRTRNISMDLAGNELEVFESSNGIDIFVTTFTYDAFNRLKEVKTPKGEKTQYYYSGTGSLLKVIDPSNKTTLYERDKMGRLKSKTTGLGQIFSYTYDSNGNLKTETDPKGNVKSYTYDKMNRVIQVNLPDDTLKARYDDVGNLVYISNNISEFNITPDSLGRTISSTLVGVGANSSYPIVPIGATYDGNHNRLSMSSNVLSMNYTKDSLDRISQIQSTSGDAFNFSYDELNRVTAVARGGTGNKTDYTYNQAGFISSISHFGGGIKKEFSTLEYDQRGLVKSKETSKGRDEFGYDENGQLISTTNSTSGVSESYGYDQLGNRTGNSTSSYVYDANLQRLTDDSEYLYYYDDNGNITAKVPKDASKKAYKYSYNSLNQLIKFQITETALGNIVLESSYIYDVLGRRIKKSVIDYANLNDTVKTYSRMYVYDGENIISEHNAQGEVLITYSHDPRNWDLILSAKVTNAGVSAKVATSPGVYQFLRDNSGSVVAIVNSSGSILQKYTYRTFGEISSITTESGIDVSAQPIFRSLYTFSGREFDEESGLYYMRARYYDPKVGRFIQEDPFAGKRTYPLSVVNRYTYANNSPVNFVDPSGAYPVTTITTGAGSNGGSAGGDSGSVYNRGAPIGYSTSPTTTTIIGSYLPPRGKDTDPVFDAPTTISVSLSVSGIGGETGGVASVGMYFGTTGEGWLDAGLTWSYGRGAGLSFGMGVDFSASNEHTHEVAGEGTNYSFGFGEFGGTFSVQDGRLKSYGGGAGPGAKYLFAITQETTGTFGVRNVLKWFGWPVQ